MSKGSLERNSGRKDKDSLAELLKRKHPELFSASPRPGGFVRSTPSKSTDRRAASPVSKATSTVELDTVHVREVLQTSTRCPNVARLAEEEDRDHAVRLCSVAVSTVMMLAQGHYKDVTPEHARHAQEYFRSLKQGEDYPPNAKQLLHLLSHLKQSGEILQNSSNDQKRPNVENSVNIE